jgi:hypothetical protein
MGDLEVEVAGTLLDHRLHHFRLACSGFEHAHVILGGESDVALAEGLQNALRALGGAPHEHRSDSLSAAFRNLSSDARIDLTALYEALCAHWDGAHSQQPGCGARERLDRESYTAPQECDSRCAAAPWDAQLRVPPRVPAFHRRDHQRKNARNAKRIEAERGYLKLLPPARTSDYEEVRVYVTSFGGFTLRRVFYTVPSRLIGHRLRVRLYDNRAELLIGGTHLMTLNRGRAGPYGEHSHVVDYRHAIHALRRKPMALVNLVYREQLFPREAFRHTFHCLLERHGERVACKTTVELHGFCTALTCIERSNQALS